MAAIATKDDELEELKSTLQDLKKCIEGTTGVVTYDWHPSVAILSDRTSALRQTSAQLSELGYGIGKVKAVLEPFQNIVKDRNNQPKFVEAPTQPAAPGRTQHAVVMRPTQQQVARTPAPVRYSRDSFVARTPELRHKMPQNVRAANSNRIFDNVLCSTQPSKVVVDSPRPGSLRYDNLGSRLVHPTPQRPIDSSFFSKVHQLTPHPKPGCVPPRQSTGIDPNITRLTMPFGTPNVRLRSSSTAIAFPRGPLVNLEPVQRDPSSGYSSIRAHHPPERLYMSPGNVPATPVTRHLQHAPPRFPSSSSSSLYGGYVDADSHQGKRARIGDYTHQIPRTEQTQMGPPVAPAPRAAYSTPMNRSHISALREHAPFTPRQGQYF